MDKNQVIVKKRKRMPAWLTSILIKAWFAGAVYFFIGWGLFINSIDQLDVTIVLGIVLGLVYDLAVNRIFLSMERGDKRYHGFMMFPKRAFYILFINILYGILIVFAVAYTYHVINIIAIRAYVLSETTVSLGVEPILFGLFCMGYDMLFLQIKKIISHIFNKKRKPINEN